MYCCSQMGTRYSADQEKTRRRVAAVLSRKLNICDYFPNSIQRGHLAEKALPQLATVAQQNHAFGILYVDALELCFVFVRVSDTHLGVDTTAGDEGIVGVELSGILHSLGADKGHGGIAQPAAGTVDLDAIVF